MDTSVTALLQHLNVDELKELLNDDGPKIEDMVKESNQVGVVFLAHFVDTFHLWCNPESSTRLLLVIQLDSIEF